MLAFDKGVSWSSSACATPAPLSAPATVEVNTLASSVSTPICSIVNLVAVISVLFLYRSNNMGI